ncbi:hypothetical protein [Vibrio sp. OPT18]|uniref:hypothetical protein n=1 Tax=Vibrio sp. OPT18 TaxID=2778641 RepID=UPI001881F100|nr:hypothetical protein [Vibrio sp. OPT18]MBE8574170.1 hypothetical protein [Vibrio sp. OPT18]
MGITKQLRLWGSVFVFLWFPVCVLASQIEVKMQGQEFQRVSLDNITDGQAPSYWELPLRLPAAQSVIPGGVTNNGARTVDVSSNGVFVSLPITVKGMVYRLSSRAATFVESSGLANVGGDGNEVLVTGMGAGNKQIELEKLESPITHFRPYLESVDGIAWMNAFKGSPKGIYQGVLPITAFYDYVRDGIRVRYTLSFSLSVVVDYTPTFLHSIDVSDDHIMAVKHHYPLKVSGETTYTVTATGYFTNGILVSLLAPESGDYFSLKSASGEKEIKYNVTCMSGCEGETQYIIDGISNITSDRPAVISAVNTDRAIAKIKVDFAPVSELEFSGETYTGKFVLMFEARV